MAWRLWLEDSQGEVEQTVTCMTSAIIGKAWQETVNHERLRAAYRSERLWEVNEFEHLKIITLHCLYEVNINITIILFVNLDVHILENVKLGREIKNMLHF